MTTKARNMLLGAIIALFLISNFSLLAVNLRLRHNLNIAQSTIFQLQAEAISASYVTPNMLEHTQLRLYNYPVLTGSDGSIDGKAIPVSQDVRDREQQGEKSLENRAASQMERVQSQTQQVMEELNANAVKALTSVPTLSLLNLKELYFSKDSNSAFTLFIFFSPTDCPVCLQESAIWQSLHHESQQLKLSVIGIADRSSNNEVTKFIKQKGITFPVLFDEKSLLRTTYKVTRTPHKILIDSKGSTVLVSPASQTPEQRRAFEKSIRERLAGNRSR
jgi:peroxiredoxin